MPESPASTPPGNAPELIAAHARIHCAIDQLRSTKTIRSRAVALLARARRGESPHFTINDSAMANAARLVAEVTRARYPQLVIPYHSRWRHFEAGGVDRASLVASQLPGATVAELARTRIDLALVAVLLDAGAGPNWHFTEPAAHGRPGATFSRSEGLGVASFHAFMAGLFSGDTDQPLRADVRGLQSITPEKLAAAFQVTESNPLVGLDGRAQLLQRLGDALAAQPEVFGTSARPGNLFDQLTRGKSAIRAHDLLGALLQTLPGIWPAQNALEGVALGDCWRHPAVVAPAADDPLTDGWMPFHKLSQWLAYSLLEPFEWAGVQVQGLDELTGLPEYRNGGLFLDAGVMGLRRVPSAGQLFSAGDELIVEWRALTVALLDEIAPLVREQLALTPDAMPLACVLEGGTWAAGRVLAQQLRDGRPPLNIISDGTVF